MAAKLGAEKLILLMRAIRNERSTNFISTPRILDVEVVEGIQSVPAAASFIRGERGEIKVHSDTTRIQ